MGEIGREVILNDQGTIFTGTPGTKIGRRQVQRDSGQWPGDGSLHPTVHQSPSGISTQVHQRRVLNRLEYSQRSVSDS